MIPDELASRIQVIWAALQSLGETEDWWLDLSNLQPALASLCVNLPSEHALRADFCANRLQKPGSPASLGAIVRVHRPRG
jgi:hypothetical protein